MMPAAAHHFHIHRAPHRRVRERKQVQWPSHIAHTDANGNTTAIGGTSFTYDNRNRLSAANDTSYDYNGKGERVYKKTSTGDAGSSMMKQAACWVSTHRRHGA